jgi:FAD/FMN-containing dehydrogenase
MESPLASDLRHLLTPEQVSVRQEELERHGTDALSRYRAFRVVEALKVKPQAVVEPNDVEEVAAVIAYAAERGVSIVPYGGGSGVMGGIIPMNGGISLDLKKFNQIYEIDVESRTALVGAGVILEDLVQALETHGLILGHDPWSVPVASVGGAISTNGVGYLAGKYGTMGDQVLGLEAVLGTGNILTSRSVPAVSGPPMKSLFIGAEGTLGIITQAAIQVFPIPELRSIFAYRFDCFEDGFQAVQEMHSIGLRPALVDMDEEFHIGDEGERGPTSTTLHLGFEGPCEEVEGQVVRGLTICSSHGGKDMGTQEAQTFWDERHRSGERYKREMRHAPHRSKRKRRSWRMDYLHVSLPSARVLEYRRACQTLLQGYDVLVPEWSIWGRPEFFSFLIAGMNIRNEGTSHQMGELVDQLLAIGQDFGGSMEYCHGIGLKLNHLMERELGPGLAVLRQLKKSMDPSGVLNPGKLGLD